MHMKRAFPLAALAGLLLLTGACTQFPELDERVTPELEAADYPALVPIDPILTAERTTGAAPAQETAAIDARVAALRSRAAALRGAVLSGAEEQRLAQGSR